MGHDILNVSHLQILWRYSTKSQSVSNVPHCFIRQVFSPPRSFICNLHKVDLLPTQSRKLFLRCSKKFNHGIGDVFFQSFKTRVLVIIHNIFNVLAEAGCKNIEEICCSWSIYRVIGDAGRRICNCSSNFGLYL